ncbi:hypothetical protein FNV43_RR13437 [Rhamnella rubrinervis]|uniref:Uncharacterized protein n=1 Tax=Rhamnella rubrinervis TaxID=2594499 RepID=A0A8K0H119_9ROSA|nr:hypothetical protein FNV43_RR13437 [Rhamnella rubrinervis]
MVSRPISQCKMLQISSLHSLIVIKGKINAFIQCFFAVRRITSLHDLEVAICNNEAIRMFEELELGPILQHPLVQHYFSVNTDRTEVFLFANSKCKSEIKERIKKTKDEKKAKKAEVMAKTLKTQGKANISKGVVLKGSKLGGSSGKH